MRGHFWTVLPHVVGGLRPARVSPPRPWSTFVDDPDRGAIQLTGLWWPAESETALVVVHGLGGGLSSPYMLRAALAASRAGLACLLVAARGADRSGADIYHAGQTSDLAAALASLELAPYSRLLLLGYSLGGHMALRAGLLAPPRLRAIAAVCAPLCLARASEAIDAPGVWIYRRHILKGLREIYREVARRGPVPTPLALIERVRTIREWDRLTVVPRYRFCSVDHYYDEMSAGPRLRSLRVPALIVESDGDPLVPPRTLDDSLARVAPDVTVMRCTGGGHVGFPVRLDLGLPGPRGLEAQVLSWLTAR